MKEDIRNQIILGVNWSFKSFGYTVEVMKTSHKGRIMLFVKKDDEDDEVVALITVYPDKDEKVVLNSASQKEKDDIKRAIVGANQNFCVWDVLEE